MSTKYPSGTLLHPKLRSGAPSVHPLPVPSSRHGGPTLPPQRHAPRSYEQASSAHTEWWRSQSTTPEESPAETPGDASASESDGAAAFWALMAFTFVLLVAPQSMFPALAPFRIALLTAALAVAAHCFGRFLRGRPVMRFTPEMWIVLCLVVWAVATVPLSYWPGGSVSFLLDFYFKTLVIFWLICNVVGTLSRLRTVAWGLTLMALPLAVAAVEHFLSGAYMPGSATSGAGRIRGYEAPLTQNPNDLALMLNLILPLSIALFLGSPSFRIRTILGCFIALSVVAIMATFSRAGFLTLAVSFLTYVWALRKRPARGFAVAALLIALAAVPFVPESYVERLGTITDIESDPTGSAQARWTDTLAAVKFVAGHPIVAAGVGQGVLAMNEVRGETWKEIHNVYLQFAVELGLPGLVLFLMLFVACVKNVLHVQRGCSQGRAHAELFYLAEGIRVSLVAFAVAALFHPVAYHFYFYYIAGLAIAARAAYAAEMSERETLAEDLQHSSGRPH